ncbi:MAG: DUF6311 domain-containing protein [Patescibacteria group bacterium]
MSDKQKNIIAALIAGILGFLFFVLIYGETLDPRYDAWLLTAGPDPVQQYLGWTMYRFSDWSFPVGLANNYAYPFGVAITFTDSIPLLAILFKLIRFGLPDTFQYFGLWISSCFVFQGIFAYRLSYLFFKKRLAAILASLFFILSPIMLFRLGGHFALGAHWLILWSLLIIFSKHYKLSWWQWSAVLAISLLVHPYLLFINLFLLLVDLLFLYFVDQKIKLKDILYFLLFQGGLILLLAYSLGLFLIGEAKAPGYGDFSMNLNALFNPMGWSNILSDLDIIRYQAEGFNYLGFGTLVLLFISSFKFFTLADLKDFFYKKWPLILVSVVLLAISLSHVVAFNSQILFTVPLNEFITDNVLALFRSSGRFFWPVFYLLVLASFYILKTLKYRLVLLILIMALFLQIYDLSGILYRRGKVFEGQVFSDSILTEQFKTASRDYKHLEFYPVYPHKNYMVFVMFAAKNKISVNSGQFSRPIAGQEKYLEAETQKIKSGQLDKDTIYVFSREADSFIANLNMVDHLYINIDNALVLFPYFNQKK